MKRIYFIPIILAIVLVFVFVKTTPKVSQIKNESASLIQTSGDRVDNSSIEDDSISASAPEVSQNLNSISSNSSSSSTKGCGSNVLARSALIRYLGDPEDIYERDSNYHWPIASISKLMTAVIATENMDMNSKVVINQNILSVEGSSGDFKDGEVFLTNDMMKAMLLLSSNRAAEGIAQTYGRDKFIELMNKKAKELQMSDTFFYEPTGLSVRNQSTPNDIYRLVSYIYSTHREIFDITKLKYAYITNLNTNKNRKVININEFAGRSDFIGGKTGFITESQGNLVSLFSVKNRPVVIVVLGSQDRFGETKKLYSCI